MKKLLLLLLLSSIGCPAPGPEPGPQPEPQPINYRELVKDIEPISDAELSAFYADFADIIERDSEIIKTTGHVREANRRAGMLLFQKTGMKGKYPGLAEKIDAAIKAALGDKDVALDRRKAVEIFRAISWATK